MKCFDIQLNEPTQIKIQWKSPKLLSQQLRKRFCKTLGTSVINSPMSPPSLKKMSLISLTILKGNPNMPSTLFEWNITSALIERFDDVPIILGIVFINVHSITVIQALLYDVKTNERIE